MKELKIKLFPAPVLTQKTNKIDEITPAIQELIKSMTNAMRKARGVGLAAPQVGESLRLAMIEHRAEENDEFEDIPLQILVNPKIISFSRETDTEKEGCLSIPGIEVPVKRARKIKVKALDENGEKIQFRATGFKARIIQHELDHLDGKLILDYATDKEKIIQKYLAKQSKFNSKQKHDDQNL
ncbi:peptide deformylase [Candidatus Berkelbacteria bacterium]|nr:peptide deformylase [Candidatus Berkelbacteria bacterium]